MKRVVADDNAINVTSGTATSVNITGLQQGNQYNVMVSPYIEGFQLGPPTTVTINTLPLGNYFLHCSCMKCVFTTDNNITIMITATSTVPATINITPSTSK